jgi:hypothetical protein
LFFLWASIADLSIDYNSLAITYAKALNLNQKR